MPMDFNRIITELCWRLEDGTPDFNNPEHLQELRVVLTMHKWDAPAINELIETLTEERTYVDNSQNRSLGRVGKPWGSSPGDSPKKSKDEPEDGKAEKEPKDDTSKNIDAKSAAEIIGDPNTGDNIDQLNMLEHGYDGFEDATGTKPALGNAGSAFNEIVSGQGVKMLHNNPELSEEELALAMYESFGETTLGKEQSKSSKTGKTPAGLDPKAYSKCVIAARSARAKFDRTNTRVEALNESGNFGKPGKPQTFYGTKKSLEAQAKAIDNASKVILPDGTEIDPEDAKSFVMLGGGGANPSDTATFISDENGVLMLQFHSDKSSPADIQDNSTLKAESDKLRSRIANNKRLTKSQRNKALKLIDRYNAKIEELEESYNDQTIPVAKNLENYPADEVAKIIDSGSDMGDPTKSTLKKNMSAALFGTKGLKARYKKFLPEGADPENLTTAQQYEMVRKMVASGGGNNYDVKVITKVGATIQNQKGDDAPDGIDVKKNLSNQRQEAVESIRERRTELNKVDPGPPPLGDAQELSSTISGFHLKVLDDIPYDSNDPEEAKRHQAIMNGSFDVNMGGVIVNKKVLEQALGVKNLDDFKKRFRLNEEEYLTKDDKGNVTGKRVFTFIINMEDDSQLPLGFKTYRSKTGSTGKSGTTLQFSPEFQDRLVAAQ